MSYIIFVNPNILSFAGDPASQHHGLPSTRCTTATCLVAGIMTILMGLYTNRAYAIAPGLGLNAIVAFTPGRGRRPDLPRRRWASSSPKASLITVLVLVGMREKIMDAIPLDLKKAIAVGIGLFIVFIGLVNVGRRRSTAQAAGRDRPAHDVADLRHVLWSDADDRAARPRCAGRPADRDRRRRRSSRRSSTSRREGRRLPRRNGELAERCLETPDLALLGNFNFDAFTELGVHLGGRLGVLAHPRRLLRHDGHARRRRQAGGLPQRGGSWQTSASHCSSTRSPRSPVARRRPPRRRPTSSPRPGSASAGAPAGSRS